MTTLTTLDIDCWRHVAHFLRSTHFEQLVMTGNARIQNLVSRVEELVLSQPTNITKNHVVKNPKFLWSIMTCLKRIEFPYRFNVSRRDERFVFHMVNLTHMAVPNMLIKLIQTENKPFRELLPNLNTVVMKINQIYLSTEQVSQMLDLPSTLQSMDLKLKNVESMPAIKSPNLTSLSCFDKNIRYITELITALPPSLTNLGIICSHFIIPDDIDVMPSFPPNLTSLYMRFNHITGVSFSWLQFWSSINTTNLCLMDFSSIYSGDVRIEFPPPYAFTPGLLRHLRIIVDQFKDTVDHDAHLKFYSFHPDIQKLCLCKCSGILNRDDWFEQNMSLLPPSTESITALNIPNIMKDVSRFTSLTSLELKNIASISNLPSTLTNLSLTKTDVIYYTQPLLKLRTMLVPYYVRVGHDIQIDEKDYSVASFSPNITHLKIPFRFRKEDSALGAEMLLQSTWSEKIKRLELLDITCCFNGIVHNKRYLDFEHVISHIVINNSIRRLYIHRSVSMIDNLKISSDLVMLQSSATICLSMLKNNNLPLSLRHILITKRHFNLNKEKNSITEIKSLLPAHVQLCIPKNGIFYCCHSGIKPHDFFEE